MALLKDDATPPPATRGLAMLKSQLAACHSALRTIIVRNDRRFPGMVRVGYAVRGHSDFVDEVWEALKDLPTVRGGLRSVYPYDHIDYAGLLILSGATARSWVYGEYDADRGIEFETDDLDQFVRRLKTNICSFHESR